MMQLDERLQRVAIIGAGGKMGRGIALLLLQEMARLEAERFGTVGSGKYHLTLIDTAEEALDTLRPYLRSFIRKYAEKQINTLRKSFKENPKLVSNEEIIDYFVDGAMDMIRLDPHIEGTYKTHLIFEAIIENIDIKTKVLSSISKNHTGDFILLTNTSSIPVHVLDEKASLGGKIVGFHFYNPPAIQKLLELIPLDRGDPKLTEIATELAKRLGKTVVVSKDVAGFIGNGHLLREIAFACKQVDDLAKGRPLHEAFYIVNLLTKHFLIRPMGIFQLLDYVGIDVAHHIINIMNTYLDETLEAPLVDTMLAAGIKGGQNPDGSQKDGFFQYHKGTLISVYSLQEKRYIPLEKSGWAEACDEEVCNLPADHMPWRVLIKDPNREKHLKQYFDHLAPMQTEGATLAKEFLHHSNEVSWKLVNDGVAKNIDDVNTVLINGFYHLYGPASSFWNHEVAK